MPSEKRERQRAGREARRAAARAAQRRAQRRRQVVAIGVLVAVVLGIGLYINQSADEDDGESVAAGDGTTTTSIAAGGEDCPEVEGERKTSFDAPPELALEPGVDYSASVCTDAGTFVVDLFEAKAPKTVNSFVFLAKNRFYEDVPFHRVIPGFVVQGGDAQNKDGTGGPGYKYEDELLAAGEYKVGSLAMANSGPNTNGSQFLVITGEDGVALPPSYSLFGEVVEGLDVVKAIEADGSPGGTPSVMHRIVNVTIVEKRG